MDIENDKQSRLHLCVGQDCNNNCIFCMEEDRDARRRRISSQTTNDLVKMMRSSNASEVMFTSGEPTLNPDLPKLLSIAKALKFETIGIITNGRRLSYQEYTRALLKNGLNHVLVSIHGPNAKIHDALCRTRGAFEQTLKGLKNLSKIKQLYPSLKIHTATVVNRINLKHIEDLLDLLSPMEIDQYVFNVMMPEGRGLRFFESLMPRYSHVAETFLGIAKKYDQRIVSKIFLLDIPYCSTTQLPDNLRGYVEMYFHYEPKEEGMQDNKSALEGDKVLYTVVKKSTHDQEVRIKRNQCSLCKYDVVCRGVFRVYIERFGWEEFNPVVEV